MDSENKPKIKDLSDYVHPSKSPESGCKNNNLDSQSKEPKDDGDNVFVLITNEFFDPIEARLQFVMDELDEYEEGDRTLDNIQNKVHEALALWREWNEWHEEE